MIACRLAGLLTLLSATLTNALTYKGADISSLIMLEQQGRTFKWTDGSTQPFEKILKNAGANSVRQRVWVSPSGGVYNLDYNIKLAKRAKAAGLSVYLTLHYSDTWADPAHQNAPSGWPTGNINDLTWKTYNYTKELCNRFKSEGVNPAIISIGNEIRTGIMWPLGGTSSWGNIASILHSAAWGIKDSTLSPKPKIMIHIDNGWDWGLQQWWYDTVLSQGPLVSSDFDMIGVSYYPFYNQNAYLGSLKYSLQQLSSRYGKEIVVAETNWPASCPSPQYPFPSDTNYIPKSIAGQKTWIQDVAKIVQGTNRGVGLYYWEPAWLGNEWLGSSCANNLLVDGNGRVRDSILAFQSI